MMLLAMKKMLQLTSQRKYVTYYIFLLKKFHFYYFITVWCRELNCHLLQNAVLYSLLKCSLFFALTVTKNVFLEIKMCILLEFLK